jgi:hypothetical protein
VTVILIRRVGGVPHYRYLSNGTHDVAYQPWSTTKFLAAANAASTLRIESGDAVGLTATIDGQALGDFVTSIASYDYDPYSSNSLGRYFHNIGGRAKANGLIHDGWLGRPASETFGGNYGEAAPALGYTFEEAGGASVTISPDGSSGPANHLSSFTMAEATKRLVLHREEPRQRLPGILWADVQTLLYGAEASPKGPFGGLSQDKAVYFQSGHDIDYLEARSHGQWRIFSKLGNGTDGQFLDVGYACLPVLDDQELPVPGWGRLVIAAICQRAARCGRSATGCWPPTSAPSSSASSTAACNRWNGSTTTTCTTSGWSLVKAGLPQPPPSCAYRLLR